MIFIFPPPPRFPRNAENAEDFYSAWKEGVTITGVSLAHYVQAFASLRRAPRGWGMKKQPHKPLLLLAVADLVGSGFFAANRIQLTPELNELFDEYWSAVLGPGDIGNIRTPFEHLEKEGFWHRTNAAQEFARGRKVIRLDDELFELLRDRESRKILKAVLINSCFEEHHAEALHEAQRRRARRRGMST